MDKAEVTNVGFEVVAYSGDARTKLLQAVAEAKAGRIEACQPLIDEAQELLNDAHNSQTARLGAEAAGEDVELGFIMVHAQDHLMTTVLLKDIVANLIDIYRG